jgi:putative SOS response-associated peptidase YedK
MMASGKQGEEPSAKRQLIRLLFAGSVYVELDVYAFMTTTPNALVATVNHERMPVLLTRPEEFETWMRGPAPEAMALAREYPPEQMQIVQTSYEKEDQLVQQAL